MIDTIRQAYDLAEEKSLPGVLMSNDAVTFNLLYELANIEVKQSSLSEHYRKT